MEGTEKIWVYIDGVKVSPKTICLHVGAYVVDEYGRLDSEGYMITLTFLDGEAITFTRGNYYKHANMFCFSSKDIII